MIEEGAEDMGDEDFEDAVTQQETEDMGDQDSQDTAHFADVPHPSKDTHSYDSAKSKAGTKQAANNANLATDARLGSFANTNVDPGFAYLAHRDKIRGSAHAALDFANVTLPRDKEISRSRTNGSDMVSGFGNARSIFEDEVRKRAIIADSPLSNPGVYRDLLPEERVVYERLLSLHWAWALKYIVVLSFGKRLSMDTLPSMDVLTNSNDLAFLISSYESAGDGLVEVDRADGTKGLSGGFSTSMLHEFGTEILTGGNTSLTRPHIAVLDVLTPNPANARRMHDGDWPSEQPFKLDCREYWNSQTEGERIAQDWSLSEMAYSCKEVRELSGKKFVFDSLSDENIDRSDSTFAYLAAALFPKLPVDAASRGPLRTARLRRPNQRAAWLKAAKMNAKKSLRTRGRRLARAAGVVIADDAAAEKYAMDHLRSLSLTARRANAKLLGIVREDGSGDLSTYSLGRGSTYLKRFRHATEAQKEKWRTEIRAKALQARRWGGEGGAAFDEYKTVLQNLQTERQMTLEEAVAFLEAVKGPDRHAYLLGLDGKSSGGPELSAAGHAATAQMRDELDDLLIRAAESDEPGFIIEVWVEEVQLARGCKHRDPANLSKYRQTEFRVGKSQDYKDIKRSIKALKLPPQPAWRSSEKTKNAWRAACTTLKFKCIQQQDMVYTYLYHKWIHDHPEA